MATRPLLPSAQPKSGVVRCQGGYISPLRLLLRKRHHLPSVARMPLSSFEAIPLLPSHLTKALFTFRVSWTANTRQLGNKSLFNTPLQLLCRSAQVSFIAGPAYLMLWLCSCSFPRDQM